MQALVRSAQLAAPGVAGGKGDDDGVGLVGERAGPALQGGTILAEAAHEHVEACVESARCRPSHRPPGFSTSSLRPCGLLGHTGPWPSVPMTTWTTRKSRVAVRDVAPSTDEREHDPVLGEDVRLEVADTALGSRLDKDVQ